MERDLVFIARGKKKDLKFVKKMFTMDMDSLKSFRSRRERFDMSAIGDVRLLSVNP